jgi:hypothetical protein
VSSSQGPAPKTVQGAEKVAIVQVDNYGVVRAIPPLPKTAAERLLNLNDPERFLDWCKIRSTLDIGVRINLRSLHSAYQSTYQDNPP